MMILCLDCQHPLDFGSDPEIGQQQVCPQCNAVLEVTWLFPLSLDYPEVKAPILSQDDEDLGQLVRSG